MPLCHFQGKFSMFTRPVVQAVVVEVQLYSFDGCVVPYTNTCLLDCIPAPALPTHCVWCDKISIETSVFFVTDPQHQGGVPSWMAVVPLTPPLPPPPSFCPPRPPAGGARRPTSYCARPLRPCLLMGCPVVTGSDSMWVAGCLLPLGKDSFFVSCSLFTFFLPTCIFEGPLSPQIQILCWPECLNLPKVSCYY